MSDLLLSLSEPRQANRRLSVQDQRLTHITDIQSDKSLHKKDQEINILGPSHAKFTISPFGSAIEHCSYGSNITSILWCVRSVGQQQLFNRRNAVRKLVKKSCLAGLKDNSKDLASLFYNSQTQNGKFKKKRMKTNVAEAEISSFFPYSSSRSNLLATGLCWLCRYPQAKMRSGLQMSGKPSPFKLHTPIFFSFSNQAS